MSTLTKSQIGFLNWICTLDLTESCKSVVHQTLHTSRIIYSDKPILNNLRNVWIEDYLNLTQQKKTYFQEYYGKYFKAEKSGDEYWLGYTEGEINVYWKVPGTRNPMFTHYDYNTVKDLFSKCVWVLVKNKKTLTF